MTTTQQNGMAWPLHWPAGRPRTPRHQRKRNPLWKGATVSTACAEIEREVELMGGVELVISTNLALRIDGLPRGGQPEPEDAGACAYFERNGRRIALACDRWASVRENLRAIGMHLAAIRGQERWGVGDLDAAFAGYQALPAPDVDRAWWDVLGLDRTTAAHLRHRPFDERREVLVARFRARAKNVHPDSGGTQEAFVELQKAYETARLELGVD
ncbi:MAG: J domain-containing protein [Planctomycetes bacterium]|nr:J domain-containing protein [Planctomycetota bacterium]